MIARGREAAGAELRGLIRTTRFASLRRAAVATTQSDAYSLE